MKKKNYTHNDSSTATQTQEKAPVVSTPITQIKRPISDKSTPKFLIIHNSSNSTITVSQPKKYKVKPHPKSNSVNSTEKNKTESAFKPAEHIFSNGDRSLITFNQFKFFLKSLGINKLISIHYEMK